MVSINKAGVVGGHVKVKFIILGAKIGLLQTSLWRVLLCILFIYCSGRHNYEYVFKDSHLFFK
jgi:hypothetical protein